jgi:hypothetical protein
MAPSDFHLFPALKDHLCGHKLASNDDVKTDGASWSKLQGTEFYEARINKPFPRLQKCLSFSGLIFKNTVVKKDDNCYLVCSKWQYVRKYMWVVNLYLDCPSYTTVERCTHFLKSYELL